MMDAPRRRPPTAMPSQIRPATSDDLDAIVHLQHAWAAEEITHGYVPATQDQLAGLLGAYFLVAVRADAIIAFAYGTPVPAEQSYGTAVIPAGVPYLEVDEIYVSARHRDLGIGGRLLDPLIATARSNGLDRFLLYSSSKDLDGILRFYRRHGFQSWAVQLYR